MRADLIAYRKPLYQVLALPEIRPSLSPRWRTAPRTAAKPIGGRHSTAQVLEGGAAVIDYRYFLPIRRLHDESETQGSPDCRRTKARSQDCRQVGGSAPLSPAPKPQAPQQTGLLQAAGRRAVGAPPLHRSATPAAAQAPGLRRAATASSRTSCAKSARRANPPS